MGIDLVEFGSGLVETDKTDPTFFTAVRKQEF
jgi:hypothetical protein